MCDYFMLADAGPGPLFLPIAGSVVVAAVFLTMALISGGLWLVRRNHDPQACLSRWFWLFLGIALAIGCIFSGIMALFQEWAIPLVVVQLLLSAWLIRIGLRTPNIAAKGQTGSE